MRPPRIYVAGSSLEPQRCHDAVLALRAAGAEVPHDWTEQVLAIGPQNETKDAASARSWAMKDLAAVMTADAILLLFSAVVAHSDPHGRVTVPSFGSGVEVGVALAHGIPVVVSGAGSIFLALVSGAAAADAEAIKLVLAAAKAEGTTEGTPS